MAIPMSPALIVRTLLRSIRRQPSVNNCKQVTLARCSSSLENKIVEVVGDEEVIQLRKSDEYGSEETFMSPEFFPPIGKRSKLQDYLERQDCFRRRLVIDIPEFYVGSILAVTTADPYALGKEKRFAGICINRKGYGLGHTFMLRNVVDGLGVEIIYDMYSPLVRKIEVLKLEKRLDVNLRYLRDALPEYSTIDPDMIPIKHVPGHPIPVNNIKVKLKPRPYSKRWERMDMQGIDYSDMPEEKMEEGKEWHMKDHTRYDLLQLWELPEDYRNQIEREIEEHEREKKKRLNESGV
ncbi:large ribosomal subunit protein bL19m-like [Antedon mediterranea]|uniref:large ribosomal subunit protein bL19m-like n=1 Tax=Antedon mediterranea TaxID=105859 RepID=UPI003AF56EBD